MVWTSGDYSCSIAGVSKVSWPVPNLYEGASLFECTQCTEVSGYQLSRLGVLDGSEHEDDDMERPTGAKNKKRKLTIEQAMGLEASFEADNKLEAEKKQRLATELGLQPRQVAVWFQNRRARSKTKQLEQDFLALKADYDVALAHRKNLQAEIAGLAAQLQANISKAKKATSCSQESTSSTKSNNDDLISESSTLRLKVVSSTKDDVAFPSNSSCDNDKHDRINEERIAKMQDMTKCSNYITGYEWEPYENELWVFD